MDWFASNAAAQRQELRSQRFVSVIPPTHHLRDALTLPIFVRDSGCSATSPRWGGESNLERLMPDPLFIPHCVTPADLPPPVWGTCPAFSMPVLSSSRSWYSIVPERSRAARASTTGLVGACERRRSPSAGSNDMGDFDWATLFGDDPQAWEEGFERAYAAVAVMVWCTIRARRLRPVMLLDDAQDDERWTGRGDASSDLSRSTITNWSRALDDAGAPPSMNNRSAPRPGPCFFDVVGEVVTKLFARERFETLRVAAHKTPSLFRGYLWRSVRNALYDMYRATAPREYNLYNNTRLALGIAWCDNRTLDTRDFPDTPPPPRTAMRGRFIIRQTFVARMSAQARADASPTTSAEAADDATLGTRLQSGLGLDARSTEQLFKLVSDSTEARETLASLLPRLLGSRCARGATIVKALIAWYCAVGPETLRQARFLPLEADDDEGKYGQRRDDPTFGPRRKQFDECVINCAKDDRDRAAAEYMLDELRANDEMPTVDALRTTLNGCGFPCSRAVAGEIHQRTTTAMKNCAGRIFDDA